MAGPEPAEVINYFRKLVNNTKYIMIQGNTDLMIADYSNDVYNSIKEKAPIMAEALKDDAKMLNEMQKYFLKKLPASKEVEFDEVKFLLVHGSPRRNNEDILPDTPIEKVEEMIADVSSDVILCGHTHLPCGFQTASKKTVVNVGSVGRPFTEKPKSCYLKINVSGGQCLFEHKFVDYDREKASKKLSSRMFAGSDKLAEMLLNPTVRHF